MPSDDTQFGQEQGSHFWFMSFMVRNAIGLAMEERSGPWTPPEGITRYDAFNELRRQVIEKSPVLANGTVLAFDIQSNHL